jgi:hypothetical protein
LLLSKKLFPVAFTVFCLHLKEKEAVSTTFFETENIDTVVKRRHIGVLMSVKITGLLDVPLSGLFYPVSEGRFFNGGFIRHRHRS